MSGAARVTALSRPLALKGWRGHSIALGGVALAVLLIFRADAADMLSIWWHASTYGHCLLIPFILAWLVQQRWTELRGLAPQPWWPGLAWLAAGGICWLMGQAAGVALFRHAGLIVMLQGAVIAMLGPNVARGLAFPIFYALFLIPFGEEAEPLLQTLTARMSMAMLGWSGVPAHLNGVFITTPTGYFEVAEACSGAKFLIAMSAYAALVCNVCFKSRSRRIAFFLFATGTSVVANGVRAFGTIYIAHLTSIDFAAGFDHVVYGWVFFGVVILLVMAVGWPFFDRRADEAFIEPERLRRPVKAVMPLRRAVALALAIAAIAPAWTALLAAQAEPVPARIPRPHIPGWTLTDAPQPVGWQPHYAGADRFVMGRYRNAGGDVVDLAIVLYAAQREGHELVGFGQGAVAPEGHWAWSAPAPAPAGAMGEQITGPGPTIRNVVTFYSIGGMVTGSAGRVKLQTLKLRLLGGDDRAVAILVSAENRPGHPAAPAMDAFLSSLGSVKDLADRSAGID